MPVILVLEDDGATRDALAETLRRLFPGTRVLATRADAEPEVVEREGASVVLAGLSTASASAGGERAGRARRRVDPRDGPGYPHEGRGARRHRVVAGADQRRAAGAVLGPMLGAAAEAGTSVDGAV